jgi:carbamoylphosphate synthase large subunit
MARKTKARPTLFQSNICTVLLVLLSLFIAPATLLLTCICYILSLITHNNLGARKLSGSHRRTVLVTGARANKALTLIRAFKREGHRVIVAEEETWGKYSMSRFSRGVDAYHLLPDPHSDPDAYIDALETIIAAERVDAWLPCSSVQATMVDSEAAKRVREKGLEGSEGCECFIPEPFVAGTLHWKNQFEALLKELDMPVPKGKIVTSTLDAVDFLHSRQAMTEGHKYLLKCLTLDDLGRDDLTQFPLATRDETFKHLSSIPTPISKKDPFLLQQFLHGPEYCTHVAARDGQIVAFVACRSNQLLMRYADVSNLGTKERAMGDQLEKWSQRFLDLYKSKLQKEGKTGREYELTGHFSFDFIFEEDEKTLYVLECNVVRQLELSTAQMEF